MRDKRPRNQESESKNEWLLDKIVDHANIALRNKPGFIRSKVFSYDPAVIIYSFSSKEAAHSHMREKQTLGRFSVEISTADDKMVIEYR